MRERQNKDMQQHTNGSSAEQGTVMHQRFTPSGNNRSGGRSFIAAELMSDDEVQVCSSAPRVTTQLLSGGMDGWMDG